jgi:A/G-specific adenine glycosylase
VPARPSLPAPARDAILAWYADHGRQLAFRRTNDPYAVLVSEAMAQQTQAARAALHWERFMERFPTVEALAAATPADVLRAWQGLGNDRRALALWRAARVIVAEHGGSVPRSVPTLEALPGVGPYTARAVAAIAFGAAVGAVDVNVRRVLGRLVDGSSAGPVGARRARDVQQLADEAVPPDRAAAWTHALMDLGATVCRSREPRCGDCPAAAWCLFAAGARPMATDVIVQAMPARRGRVRATPFRATNRWLRGRILDRLRAATDGEWVGLDGPIGDHPHERVRAAVRALAADGIIELDRRDESWRARLPLA